MKCGLYKIRKMTLYFSLIWLMLSCFFPLYAAERKPLQLEDLLDMDLRALMNINITLASRIDETQFTTPAATYIVTQEDIRRSGLRRIPEILRLIPGLHVAKIDNNKWEMGMRNLHSRFNSTMLVMIDGRHIYTPFSAGVNWEAQNVFIDDIERIEVVRGPGGSLWGANAVDGIINIITKNTRNTLGTTAYAALGEGELRHELGVRYGGKTNNNIHYRLFARNF